MKAILNLASALTNIESSDKKVKFYEGQFKNFGNDKNILFLNPQLSGKQLYKTFLPYIGLYDSNVFTALTSISKYNPREQLTDPDCPINTKQIVWADFIVIPFTAMNLTVGDTNLYDAIKKINENCKIVFSVDFNFYTLSDMHPYKDIFSEQGIHNVEDNIWSCDICLINNMVFKDYLMDKMKILMAGRKNGIPTKATIGCLPFFINSDIILENMEDDYEAQSPEKVVGFIPYNDPKTIQNLKNISDVAESPSKSRFQIRVLKEGEKWVVKKGKAKKHFNSYAKKSLAIEEAKKFIEKKYDVIIYKADGTVQQTFIYEHQKS